MTTSATPVPTKTRRQQRRRSRRLSPPLSPLRGTIDRSGKRRSPAPDEAKEWEDRIREDFANHLKAKGIGRLEAVPVHRHALPHRGQCVAVERRP